jgi:hypothetical protein
MKEVTHLNATCPIKIGDKVTTDINYKMKNKVCVVLEVTRTANCTSGYLVKISNYPRPVDSTWLTKVN